MCIRSGIARAALLAVVFALLPATMPAAVPAHYIVFEASPEGATEPVFFRDVHLAALPASLPEARIDAAMRSPAFAAGDRVALRVEDPAGETVYRQIVRVPRGLRGEFRGTLLDGGVWSVDAHRIGGGSRAFAVRIPAISAGKLVIDGPTRATFDIQTLAAEADTMRLHELSEVKRQSSQLLISGSPANRVDILIVGDGYTAAQQAIFDAHVGEFETWFFAMTPYGEYENFVNVGSLFVASAESGADHPPYDEGCSGSLSCCADPDALTDPLAGTFVETAFDGRFCAFDIHRLLVVDTAAVFAAASAVPDWDKIVVAVNDPVYGGSGGPLSVTSVHEDGLEIIQHEYGHSFTGLADEYDDPTPGYPPCSDITGPVCEANVTDETVRALIKWEPWIEPATPVPTPEGLPEYAGVVGLFEGGRYMQTGMYRPRDLECMMNVFAPGFCQICSQEYVKRLYAGGWGVPAGGIELIEPGSESPPTDTTVDGTSGVTLSVGLLDPIGAPPVTVTWLVDGVPEPPQSGVPRGSYQFDRTAPGLYQVEAQVDDVTPLVHPDMDDGLLRSTATWQVQVGPGAGPGQALSLSVGPSPTAGHLRVSWLPSCQADAVDYAVYEGSLGNWYSHTLKDCTDDGVPFEEDILPAAGDTYYLVVPLGDTEEGSYGLDSGSQPRPRGTAVCRGAQLASTCP